MGFRDEWGQVVDAVRVGEWDVASIHVDQECLVHRCPRVGWVGCNLAQKWNIFGKFFYIIKPT